MKTLKLNSRHKIALAYLAAYPDKDMYPPKRCGEATMQDLIDCGYVTRERQWIGYTYTITPKGLNRYNNTIPDSVAEKVDRWNAKVRDFQAASENVRTEVAK